jgi:Protein of unknown function (DUF2726)
VRGRNFPSQRQSGEHPLPYLKRDSLLTRGELAFFRVLLRVIGNCFGVSIKTRLADIVKCPDELWDTPHGRRLCQKHIDFVLYDRNTSSVIAAVELDDASHDEPARRNRDRFVDAVFKTVSVRLIRIRAASRYDYEAIRSVVFEAQREPMKTSGRPRRMRRFASKVRQRAAYSRSRRYFHGP